MFCLLFDSFRLVKYLNSKHELPLEPTAHKGHYGWVIYRTKTSLVRAVFEILCGFAETKIVFFKTRVRRV